MTLQQLNELGEEQARQQLFSCCGSDTWINEVMKTYPFTSTQALLDTVTHAWYDACGKQDWLQAFSQHPKIGDLQSLEEKYASSKHLAGAEQAGVANASINIIEELAIANTAYEEKFDFIFIVCATGKSAEEMLRLLNDRLKNSYGEELAIAMGEQQKITLIRLKKLLTGEDWSWLKASQLTTHVLDTSIGKPGRNITIRLQQQVNEAWQTIALGVTNADGRIADLLPSMRTLQATSYKMVFETAAYFQKQQVQGFYPLVEIQFNVFDDQHYHVPLLINPFGYSTYRGS